MERAKFTLYLPLAKKGTETRAELIGAKPRTSQLRKKYHIFRAAKFDQIQSNYIDNELRKRENSKKRKRKNLEKRQQRRNLSAVEKMQKKRQKRNAKIRVK